jgi:hypothetical protein
MFADEFLTKELLCRLGIEDTAQLPADHWHLKCGLVLCSGERLLEDHD